MTYGLTPRQKEARGVVTNGEGEQTAAHLNLSRSLDEIWADEQAMEAQKLERERQARVPKRPYRPRAFRQRGKIGYAGRAEGGSF